MSTVVRDPAAPDVPVVAGGPRDAATGLASAVYLGGVRHRRHLPVPHAFRYRTAFLYLDLAELPDALDHHRGWGVERRAPLAFRRADHHGDPAVPLDVAIRDTVEARTGRRPEGPVRVLLQPRLLGRSFNPVTFAYCFAPDGATLEAVLAEVTNTPWNERHAYVLDARDADWDGDSLVATFDKVFHVSPFQAMDHRYAWRLNVPGEHVRVHVDSDRDGERVFDATLSMRRRPLDRGGLRAFVGLQPFGVFAVTARIYVQALRLWLKRVPVFPHPDARSRETR